jgi:hypothetical protein
MHDGIRRQAAFVVVADLDCRGVVAGVGVQMVEVERLAGQRQRRTDGERRGSGRRVSVINGAGPGVGAGIGERARLGEVLTRGDRRFSQREQRRDILECDGVFR